VFEKGDGVVSSPRHETRDVVRKGGLGALDREEALRVSVPADVVRKAGVDRAARFDAQPHPTSRIDDRRRFEGSHEHDIRVSLDEHVGVELRSERSFTSCCTSQPRIGFPRAWTHRFDRSPSPRVFTR
jgi:hypothetical protein